MLTWRVFAHPGSLATDRLLERGLAARLSRLSATKSLISSSFTSILEKDSELDLPVPMVNLEALKALEGHIH